MNIDAIPIGRNPPDDLNVIIEVPLGGEPIKYEIDKASGALFVDRSSIPRCVTPETTASSRTRSAATAIRWTSS
jgi:hypothetical protein